MYTIHRTRAPRAARAPRRGAARAEGL
eukprot:COSAG02_NODE_27516_length_607_cov_47.970472_1_plen_26_part_10